MLPNYQHPLVIRLSALGDIAMLVPVIRALITHHPNIKVTIVTSALAAHFFGNIPNLRVYVPALTKAHKGLWGIYKLAQELYKLDLDVVVDLHNVLRSNVLIRLLRLRGIPFRQMDKGRAEKRRLVRAKNKIFRPLKPTHERYADVFRALGYTLSLEPPSRLAKKNLPEKLVSYIGTKAKKKIGIAPYATHKGKEYPMNFIAQVVARLDKNKDYAILLFASAERATHLEKLAIGHENVLNMAGKFPFEEELILIANLDVMLSMDSANGHIAAMLGVQVLTIWGVTHPYAGFAPFYQPKANQILPDLTKYPLIPTSIYGNKYPKGYLACFDTIDISEITDKLTRLIKTS